MTYLNEEDFTRLTQQEQEAYLKIIAPSCPPFDWSEYLTWYFREREYQQNAE